MEGRHHGSQPEPVLIGITGRRLSAELLPSLEERYRGYEFDMYFSSFSKAVYAGGAIPVTLPYESAGTGVISRLDGLVITGGQDVDPHEWGGDRGCAVGPIDTERDAYELNLIARAAEHRVPVLGVCRGMQLINVALGGTLVGDLNRDAIDHTSPGRCASERVHSVATEPNSVARGIYGESLTVNSLHHQAVGDPGKGVAITGRAPDGTAEILEDPQGRILGVQWHPEWLTEPDPAFGWLVNAATDRRFECLEAS